MDLVGAVYLADEIRLGCSVWLVLLTQILIFMSITSIQCSVSDRFPLWNGRDSPVF